MKGTNYQKAVQELIKERPSPGRHAAFNALRHISKAWDLRNLDREMAVFRSFCAEEEAATAIFHALRRLRYPGAERLKHRDHVQKAAVMPFLWMVNKAFTIVYEERFQPTVAIAEEEGRKQTSSKFSLRIWLDKQTLSDHRNYIKLQTSSFSYEKPHPAAMRPWRRVEPT